MAIQQSQTVEKRQKIRDLALGLLCAAFALSGCERSEEEPLALLTLDKERIVFDNPAEGETAQAVLLISENLLQEKPVQQMIVKMRILSALLLMLLQAYGSVMMITLRWAGLQAEQYLLLSGKML
mgnify:CR=1 FL=1